MNWPYSLGCPVWACEHWRGSLYTRKSKRADWLAEYSATFQTVEGNSTFYALPTVETARRWAETTLAGFEFCLKFPRVISHDQMLRNCANALRPWLQILDALAACDRLGPSFLQLPPNFAADRFGDLAAFLRNWPKQFPLAVEVRHRDWFDQADCENRLNELLASMSVDRVLFDARALYSRPPETAAEEVSQTRKPRSPLRHTLTGQRPFVRFIGRDDVGSVDPWIEEWATQTADWIRRGLKPLVFAHAPDDTFAPEFARRFHEALTAKVPGLATLPPFAGESEPAPAEQLSLF